MKATVHSRRLCVAALAVVLTAAGCGGCCSEPLLLLGLTLVPDAGALHGGTVAFCALDGGACGTPQVVPKSGLVPIDGVSIGQDFLASICACDFAPESVVIHFVPLPGECGGEGLNPAQVALVAQPGACAATCCDAGQADAGC
jgi:hypothetical protein